MRTLAALLLASLITACASPAGAGRLVDVQIVGRSSGRILETYKHAGNTYVSGNPGERYAVRLVNRSGARVLAVLSVDGVNAISGETAAPDQSGYVLEPYASAEIAGWRKSMQEVAQFYFTSLPDSYAARTERPDNVGVIGVAVWRERERPRPVPYSSERRAQPAPAPGAAAQDAAPAAESAAGALSKKAEPSRLGTGHGEREYAPTKYTEFVRARRSPDEIVSVRYDSYANLLARGIIGRTPRHAEPQPFPGRFVPDPQG